MKEVRRQESEFRMLNQRTFNIERPTPNFQKKPVLFFIQHSMLNVRGSFSPLPSAQCSLPFAYSTPTLPYSIAPVF
jgi:hypothetical protein